MELAILPIPFLIFSIEQAKTHYPDHNLLIDVLKRELVPKRTKLNYFCNLSELIRSSGYHCGSILYGNA